MDIAETCSTRCRGINHKGDFRRRKADIDNEWSCIPWQSARINENGIDFAFINYSFGFLLQIGKSVASDGWIVDKGLYATFMC